MLIEGGFTLRAPIDRLFEAVVVGPVLAKASDIHIVPTREEAIVSQRIDGVLHEVVRLPRTVHRALVAAVKAHADMVVEQEQIAQDGRFILSLEVEQEQIAEDGEPVMARVEREYDYRVATLPALYGESVTMRILDRSHVMIGLDRLGMSPRDQERFRHGFVQPNGLLICSGPTGSGKTTVLYSGLKEIISPEKRIYSVEDPVEVALEGVTQVPVNRRTGMTMEYTLRTLVRHDPDVIVVSDLGTQEVGEVCVQAGLTGHLVLATVHATSAANAIARLLDLDLDPFMLTQSLICVVGTRLTRRVCPECKQPDTPTEEVLAPYVELARAGGYVLPANPTFYKGAGCEHCRGTGYRGRVGLFEVMEINEEINRLILTRQPAKAIQEAAVRNGMTTIVADGIRKAAEGVTTLFEAVRVTRDLAV